MFNHLKQTTVIIHSPLLTGYFKIEHVYFLNVLRHNLTMCFPWRSSREKSHIFQPFLSLENSKHICTNLVIKKITVPAAIILASTILQNDVCFKGHTTRLLNKKCESCLRAGTYKKE